MAVRNDTSSVCIVVVLLLPSSTTNELRELADGSKRTHQVDLKLV